MSNLAEYAEKEMQLAWPEKCEMQDMIKENILELIEIFSSQGHSGMTAPYVLEHFNKLARFEPIKPLTGDDDEWHECSDGVYQNKRCSEVFKNGKSGQAYWINGNVFRNQDGHTYTSDKSSVAINFPWTRPKPNVVDVFER